MNIFNRKPKEPTILIKCISCGGARIDTGMTREELLLRPIHTAENIRAHEAIFHNTNLLLEVKK